MPVGGLQQRGASMCLAIGTGCVAFWTENISAPNLSYAGQYLACALPCERFTSALGDIRASLGAGAVRYSFTMTDSTVCLLPVSGAPAQTCRRPRALRKGADVRGRASVRDEISPRARNSRPPRVADEAKKADACESHRWEVRGRWRLAGLPNFSHIPSATCGRADFRCFVSLPPLTRDASAISAITGGLWAADRC